MKVTFKTKPVERQAFLPNGDTKIYQVYNIPKIKRCHCDMNAARNHPRYSGFANSDMFERMVQRDIAAKYGSFIACENATAKAVGFLHEVDINLD